MSDLVGTFWCGHRVSAVSALVGTLWDSKDGKRTIEIVSQMGRHLQVVNVDTGRCSWITISGLMRKFDDAV